MFVILPFNLSHLEFSVFYYRIMPFIKVILQPLCFFETDKIAYQYIMENIWNI